VGGQAGLRVQVLASDGGVVDETRTGPDGWYRFPPLPSGLYRLRVLDERGRPLALTQDAQVEIRPEPAQIPSEHRLPLAMPVSPDGTRSAEHPPAPMSQAQPAGVQANGYITGVVTAADTELPQWQLYVNVYNNSGSLQTWDSPDYSTGVYNIPVPPGTYRIEFEPYGSSIYVPEWYDNQRSFASATPVVVAEGAVVPNINASLDVGGQIAGRVTATSGGAPLNNVTVYAYTSITSTSSVASDYTDASGVYTITGLVTGTYYLEFDPPYGSDYLAEYYNDKRSLATADPIPVTLGSVVSGKDAALETGGKIAGRVTAAGSDTPLASVYVYAYTSTTSTSSVAYDYTDASGIYTITRLLTGTYYLEFVPPYGSDYFGEYYNNKSTLAAADGVSVVLGGVVTGIDAVLDLGSKIAGRVTAAGSSTPLASVYVYAYTSTTGTSSVASDYTDASGIYTITRLLTGTYYLEFVPPYGSDYLVEYYNDKRSLATADPIPVTLGGVVSGKDAALETGGKIAGRVTAAGSGTPLASVYVYAYTSTTSTDDVAYDYTDASGVYTITGLMTGTYYLKFEPSYGSDYFGEYYNNKSTLAAADGISVVLGGVETGIDAALDLGGKIAGRVTAAGSSTPLASVYVYAYTSTTSTDYVAYDSTDASGIYTITRLLTGTYYLKFVPPYGSDYLVEYYNDKRSLATADPIPVTLGSVVSGKDAALETGGKIAGRVTAAGSGTPLASVHVYAYTSTTSTDDVAYDSTDASGIYTITRLLPGTYYLQFYPPYGSDYFGEYYNNKSTPAAADGISVVLGGVETGIDAALDLGGKIAGRVTAAGSGTPLASVYVYAYTSTTSTDYVAYDSTDASGIYTITRLLTGTYYLQLAPSYGSDYIGEYYNNKPTLAAADGVSVALGGVVTGIDAALDLGGKITGRVTAAANGQPLQNVYVYVYTTTGTCGAGSVAYGYTDASGVYTITGLVTGTYYLEFKPSYGSDYLGEYYNDKSSLATADGVSVSLGAVVSGIDAALRTASKITGRVTAAGSSAPLEDVEVIVYGYRCT
jgi:hypothetical protein